MLFKLVTCWTPLENGLLSYGLVKRCGIDREMPCLVRDYKNYPSYTTDYCF